MDIGGFIRSAQAVVKRLSMMVLGLMSLFGLCAWGCFMLMLSKQRQEMRSQMGAMRYLGLTPERQYVLRDMLLLITILAMCLAGTLGLGLMTYIAQIKLGFDWSIDWSITLLLLFIPVPWGWAH